MWDIILESVRSGVIALILFYIYNVGRERGFDKLRGWKTILAGWSLILLGSLLDITDNFESLNWLLIVGDTEVEAFLEKFVGYLLGYVFLFFGFLYWLPAGAIKMESLKSDFVSTVSHELRTPLTAIYGSLKMISSGKLGEIPASAQLPLDMALRNSERLTRLVNDILDMDKLQNGQMGMVLLDYDAKILVEEAIAANMHYANEYHVNFVMDNESESDFICVDSNRFMQIMDNLLSNAAKFSQDNGTVSISLTTNNGYLRVTVKDNGKGIDEDSQSLIFKRFFQENSGNTRHSGGTGLGLAISKGLVEGMKGKIGFSTEVGVGTAFYFDLPISQQPSDALLNMGYTYNN